MAIMEATGLSEAIRQAAQPLTGAPSDYDPLLEMIGEAPLVLMGEASHGTHEFYHERAQITKRLIREKGFTAVAVEADWPDAYRVNRFVRGQGEDAASLDALADFKRFPTWMWRNADVLDFVGWLRAHNDERPREARAGFYGLDLYSLSNSIEAVLGYLDQVDPEAARRARYRYGCFEDFGEDPQAYGYAASFNLGASCEDEVVRQLTELQRQANLYLRRDGHVAADAQFYAEQNARLVKNAEAYYRAMFRGQVESWNLRDRHMAETASTLLSHLDQPGRKAKLVIWAHNSHLGDARSTEMGQRGELNVGQLLRERYGREAVLVGFTTHTGTVTAASDWGEPAERKRVRPSLPESHERTLHEAGLPRFMLGLRDEPELREPLNIPRLERAIGVIYRPETERMSHYFHAQLAQQFDAVLHFDTTRAVEPLERNAEWQPEVPETYPTGL
jgi:erythromycin esterase-like protein